MDEFYLRDGPKLVNRGAGSGWGVWCVVVMRGCERVLGRRGFSLLARNNNSLHALFQTFQKLIYCIFFWKIWIHLSTLRSLSVRYSENDSYTSPRHPHNRKNTDIFSRSPSVQHIFPDGCLGILQHCKWSFPSISWRSRRDRRTFTCLFVT